MTDLPISIIVASYNHAEYLEERMDTLLNQTFDKFEIIVVDDCSTDNSTEVLEKYRDNPKTTFIFLEENGGYAKACNLGISKSRGE